MRGAGIVVAALLAAAAGCMLYLAAAGEPPTLRAPPPPAPQTPAPQTPAPQTPAIPSLGSPPERRLVIEPELAPVPAPAEPAPPHAARPSRPVIRTVEEKPSLEPLAAVPPPTEPLDAEELARGTLRSARGAFEACYEQSLRRDAKVRGRVVVQVNVQASGRVSSSRIVESTVKDERVRGCISARLRQLRFPPLGAEVELTVPFSLVPRL